MTLGKKMWDKLTNKEGLKAQNDAAAAQLAAQEQQASAMLQQQRDMQANLTTENVVDVRSGAEALETSDKRKRPVSKQGRSLSAQLGIGGGL